MASFLLLTACLLACLLQHRPALLAGVPPEQQPAAEALLDELFAKLKQLELAVKTQQPDFVGVRIADSLQRIAELEAELS